VRGSRASDTRSIHGFATESGNNLNLGTARAHLDHKIVQAATVTILNQIYEEDFLGFCVLQKCRDMEVI